MATSTFPFAELLQGVLTGVAGVATGVILGHGMHSLASRTVYHKYNNEHHAPYFAVCVAAGGSVCVAGSAIAVVGFGQSLLSVYTFVGALQFFLHGIAPKIFLT